MCANAHWILKCIDVSSSGHGKCRCPEPNTYLLYVPSGELEKKEERCV
jgi:hypothetical protein